MGFDAFSPTFAPKNLHLTHFWTHFGPLTKTHLKPTFSGNKSFPKKGPLRQPLTQHKWKLKNELRNRSLDRFIETCFSPANFVDFLFEFAWIWHCKMARVFGDFLVVSVSQEIKHEKSSKLRGIFGEKFGLKFGMEIPKIRRNFRSATFLSYYEARNDYTNNSETILLCNRCGCNWKINSQRMLLCKWRLQRVPHGGALITQKNSCQKALCNRCPV